MTGLSVSGAEANDQELVAVRLYKDVVVGAVPLAAAKELSRAERKETKQSQTTLIYGEISFSAMALILGKVRASCASCRMVCPCPCD